MRFSQEKEGTTGKGKGGGVDEKMVPLRFLCVGLDFSKGFYNNIQFE